MASQLRDRRHVPVPARRIVTALVAVLSLSAAAATAAPVTTGQYAGSTSQGVPASLMISGGRVRQASFRWTARCATSGQTVHNTTSFSSLALRGRRFSAHGSSSAPVATGYRGMFSETVQGTISTAKVSGTFAATMRVYRTGSGALVDTCRSGTLRFTLRRR